MHQPKSVLENEMHKILWDFEIQTDHRIPARRSERVIINKKKRNCHLVNSVVPADLRVKKRKKAKGKIFVSFEVAEKAVEYESDYDHNYKFWVYKQSPKG